ncbi:unnamed protein product [Polarella glacialis]|uniref:SAM domain-containing protein n=1 Tax=Polarella glacialis TaxID=89957 RepID=A0A813J7G0_POLGL|nr:unnamed protein product [Polarella glacialis]
MARFLRPLTVLLPLCFAKDACPARGSMASWTPDQVGEWLRLLGIDQETVAKFADQEVDELSDAELKTELGVQKLGPRKKILQSLASCAGPATSNTPATQTSAGKQQLGPSEPLPGVSQELLELAAFGKIDELSMHFLAILLTSSNWQCYLSSTRSGGRPAPAGLRLPSSLQRWCPKTSARDCIRWACQRHSDSEQKLFRD